MSGKIWAVGLGPGSEALLAPAARHALEQADTIVGYKTYLKLIEQIAPGTPRQASGMRHEVERVNLAVDLAEAGQRVAVVSSGDAGVYGMAGLVFEVLRERGSDSVEVEVVPGISALNAAAALLGAPLMTDFAAISLSDQLVPLDGILRRVDLAAQAGFILCLYNPKGVNRVEPFNRACDILLRQLPPDTPVGVVRAAYRSKQQVEVITLAQLPTAEVNMVTVIVIGNRQTLAYNGKMLTPRGYADKYELDSAQEHRPPSIPPAGGEVVAPPPLKEEVVAPPPSGGRWGGGQTPPTESARARRAEQPVYPISLTQLAGRRVVVIGGGPVGERKTRGLLATGAAVTLISPEATPQLADWAAAGQIEWQQRGYRPGDLSGAALAFAATNQRAINAQIAANAAALNLLCNVADAPDEGSFHLPAVHRQSGLTVAVSTHGSSPGKAAELRNQLAGWLDENYEL